MTGQGRDDGGGQLVHQRAAHLRPEHRIRRGKGPVPGGGRAGGTIFQSNVFLLPKGAKRPDLAYRFFNFCDTTPILANNFDIWRSIPTNDKQFDEVSWTTEGRPDLQDRTGACQLSQLGSCGAHPVAAQLGDDLNAMRDDVIYNNKDPLPLLQAPSGQVREAARAVSADLPFLEGAEAPTTISDARARSPRGPGIRLITAALLA